MELGDDGILRFTEEELNRFAALTEGFQQYCIEMVANDDHPEPTELGRRVLPASFDHVLFQVLGIAKVRFGGWHVFAKLWFFQCLSHLLLDGLERRALATAMMESISGIVPDPQ